MVRTTRQREAVRTVCADVEGFLSAQEMHARLRAAGDPVRLEHGFADVSHSLEIFGTFAECGTPGRRLRGSSRRR